MIYDYIIIGSGIAGLNAARLIPKEKKVLVISKKFPWECNTFYAQGGVAVAVDSDDIEPHIEDTINAGAHHNNVEAVRILSENSKKCIEELVNEGLQFDRSVRYDGLAYTKEAAHSRDRIVHADGDATGRMIHLFLLQKCFHKIKSNCIVCDLLIQDDICYGVQYFNSNKELEVAYAHNTIIASGGIGSIYKYHTNSTAVAGEIQGICLEKGLKLQDMEMMQFHPTVVKGTSFARKPLLSEALRGEGAYIVDDENRKFLFDYHEDGELAPRDIVSRAIFDYARKTKKGIFLSFDNFEKNMFKKRFPNIYANLKDLGFELPFEKVPISPAFHYAMGGIKTNLNTQVDGMKNLFAIGEASCTGLHGANRLASNSLLEGMVFSKISVEFSQKENYKIDIKNYKKKIEKYSKSQDIDKEVKNALRKLMWENAAIVREKKELEKALFQVDEFLTKNVGRLVFLRLLTAKSILVSAIKRTSSLGAHFIKES